MKPTVFKRSLAGIALATIAVFSVSALISAAPSGLRSIFLNGTDISGARNQVLKNVDIQITEGGDIFIIAPHYQVSEEDAFTPLSKYVQGINAPQHKPPQKVAPDQGPIASATISAAVAPATNGEQPLDKPGVPVGEGGMQKQEDPPPALPEDAEK